MVLLSPKDAGAVLGISTSGVIQMVLRGKLREIRDSSGRRLFKPADVERARQEREARSRRRIA